LKDGKIVSSDMNRVIDVKIRDMSSSGALVHTPANVVLPDNFNLLLFQRGCFTLPWCVGAKGKPWALDLPESPAIRLADW
jgi:hypothetical protein